MSFRLILAGVSLLALSGAAAAADLPLRSAPPVYAPPLPVFTWTGAYFGINAGYDFSNSNRVDVGLPGGLGLGNASVGGFSLNGNHARLRSESDGFTGGGQIGYNYQFGAGNGIVVGVEIDGEYMDADRTNNYDTTGLLGVPSTARYKTSLDYLSTIRGRVGYAFGQTFVYGTGGFAFGGVNRRGSVIDGTGATLASLSINDTETGYAYGGGIEYALPTDSFLNFFHSSAVTLRGEYLHYELDGTNAALNVAGTTVTGKLHNDGDLARAGINFKF